MCPAYNNIMVLITAGLGSSTKGNPGAHPPFLHAKPASAAVKVGWFCRLAGTIVPYVDNGILMSVIGNVMICLFRR